MSEPAPLVLLILDGFGYSPKNDHNAISKAYTPNWDHWMKNCPHVMIDASGQSVGLPSTQMGNSEVGHMHIGSGRKIEQDLTRINQAIQSGDLAKHPLLLKTLKNLSETQSAFHLMGLLSPGGVHSHEAHLFALLQTCATYLANPNHHPIPIHLHLFLDGRDTSPQSAIQSLTKLEGWLKKLNANISETMTIRSISGRFYAMDRDKRWERIQPVYDILCEGHSEYLFDSPTEAISEFYRQNIFDEFIPPTRIGHANEKVYPLKDNDAVLFFNFRADRARELTASLTQPNCPIKKQHDLPKLAHFISMTDYGDTLLTEPLFPTYELNDTLGEVVASNHLKQLRIAETEKYAHVTFFLNGGLESAFEGETRILIPSPKVKTYDLAPEMSAPQITEAIVDAIEKSEFDLIICNFANADMVGHTGNFDATCQAVAYLDKAMGKIAKALELKGGELLITADHGNAEQMYDSLTHLAHTAHTTNLVPCVYVGPKSIQPSINAVGSLADIAPTVLTLMNLSIPSAMTGKSLFTSLS